MLKAPDLGQLEALYGWRLADAVTRDRVLHLTFEMPQGQDTEPKRAHILLSVRTETATGSESDTCDECDEYTTMEYQHEINPTIHIK